MTTESTPSEKPASGPSRDDLISLCERGVVAESHWHDRDSAGAQRQLGEALALLRAGCDFRLAGSPQQTHDTWWIEVTYKGFDYFEVGNETTETFYVPTAARLERTAGRDWY